MSEVSISERRVQGTVAPGFESVLQTYEREIQTKAEKNTQLCVYYKGERVVDLWASNTNDPDFSPDSLINVFSSGKSLAAIAMASLAGRGLLDYQARIADYWPEFAANGKAEITVADLMRHEAGLAAFDTSIEPEHFHAEHLKRNAVGKIIEAHPARFPHGSSSNREYHAITRGWVANEVFRRVDPSGRTIGEFLREDISTPLAADAIIGVDEADLGRISNVSPLAWSFVFLESLKPRFLGRRVQHHLFQILGRILKMIPGIRRSTTGDAPPPFKGLQVIEAFNHPSVSMGETPSAGSKCSARGLARIAAMMSNGGSFGGKQYIGEEGWEAMHAAPTTASMIFAPTIFTQGGVNQYVASDATSSRIHRAFNEGREGFFGWMGLGGSIFQWHPGHDIGFAFVPTALHVLDLMNERGKVYQAEVLRCVERMEGVVRTR